MRKNYEGEGKKQKRWGGGERGKGIARKKMNQKADVERETEKEGTSTSLSIKS
jgi:hypothetical protein